MNPNKPFTASNGIKMMMEKGILFTVNHDLNDSTAATDAAREYFEWEKDLDLGRWRDPENPEYVVYPTVDENTVMVFNERVGVAIPCGRDTFVQAAIEIGDDHTFPISDHDLAAARYFKAHPEPKPWHNAKPGEVWVLTIKGVPKETVGLFTNLNLFETVDFTYPPNDLLITAGRRAFESIDTEGIARAIHDGPEAQRQYAKAGVAPHSWDDCDYREQYLNDAHAVTAWLTGKDQQ